jgi:RHS repeat-associated protein
MPLARTFLVPLVSLLFGALCMVPTRAQITQVTDTTSTPTPGVGHDYLHFLQETVNPANGSLSVRIGVPAPPGRKLTLPFSFAYDSNGVHYFVLDETGATTWKSNRTFLSQGGWSYSMPLISTNQRTIDFTDLNGIEHRCDYLNDYVFQDPSAHRSSLFLAYIQPDTSTNCGSGFPPATTQLNGGDGFYTSVMAPDGSHVPPVYVADRDGTVYHFPSQLEAGPVDFSNFSALPDRVEDRNGNVITIVDYMNGGGFEVIDTTNRIPIYSSGFGNHGDTLWVDGLPSPYTLTWNSTPATWVPMHNIVYASGSASNCTGPQALSETDNVVTQIALPNGQSYQFSYDGAGLLHQIVYPDGGTVTYTWDRNAFSEGAEIQVPNTNIPGFSCLFTYDTYAVKQRQVSFDGTNIALEQDFLYDTYYPSNSIRWTSKHTTVTTRDCARNGFDCLTAPSTTTVYTYSPVDVPMQPAEQSLDTAQTPLEQKIEQQDATGSVVLTVVKAWNYDSGTGLPTVACELQMLDNGLISGTFFSYATDSPTLMTDKREFDYGQITSLDACPTSASGITPVRETIVVYQRFNYQPSGTTRIFPSGDATSPIMDRPCRVQVFASDAARTTLSEAAETDYFYDADNVLCRTAADGPSPTPNVTGVSNLIAATHDDTYYGLGSTLPRGNVSTVTRLCFQQPSFEPCSDNVFATNYPPYNPTTTYAYDVTGQVLSATDPCGNSNTCLTPSSSHTTQYSYTDNYDQAPSGNTNAMLTSITDPLGHVTQFQYAYSDRQLIGSTDANGNITRYYYFDPNTGLVDPLRRLTAVNYPDLGSKSIVYDDTPNAASVTVTSLMSASPARSISSRVSLDGMGHRIQRVILNDPDCASGDKTDTTYDGFGRVLSVSNAYCTPGEGSSGVTMYEYDALGRATSVTAADGSATGYFYSGNSLTVRDPALKWRTTNLDALGRLTSVAENLTNPNTFQTTYFQTSYTYDALNNLTSVTQNGDNSNLARVRAFSYDSLSRLTSATNPESGTISYLYDPNGNLLRRAAPAPNQSDPTKLLATCYLYDALNRLYQRNYLADNCTTSLDVFPPATFIYDNAAGPNPSTANLIGRLTQEIVYLPGGTVISTYPRFGYDPMGRPLSKDACVDSSSNCGFSYNYWDLNYSYDLVGNIVSSGDAVADSFTYTFSLANRLIQIQSSLSDAAHPPQLLSNARYNALGALTYVDRGNAAGGIGVADTAVFNSRLQLCRTNVNASATQMQTCGDPAPSASLLDLSYGYISHDPGAQNSGSPTSNNGNVTSMLASGAQAFNRTYTYDSLNRLSTMSSPGQSCGGLSWVYDAWGNRQTQSPIGSCPLVQQNYDGQNHAIGFTYDAAGNLINDGVHTYYYDGESRLIQVGGSTLGDCSTACYQYDAEGKRVLKTLGSAQTLYLYDPSGTLTTEVDNFNNTFATSIVNYIYANGALFAEYIYRYGQPPGQTVFIHRDHIGSTRLVTDINGNILDSFDFLPFGEQVSGDGVTTLKFTGQPRDAESGLDYFGARFYQSALGRFLTPDRLGNLVADRSDPQTWNMYAYARNSPLTFVDPAGTCSVQPGDETATDDPDQPCLEPGSTSITVNDTALPVPYDVWNSVTHQWQLGDPRASLSMLDLPGQFYVGFGSLILNDDPSELWRVPYSIGANLLGGLLISKALGLAGSGGTIVLGSKGYVQIGGVVGADTLSFTDAAWAELGEQGQVDAMRTFIREAIKDGKQIVLTNDPAAADAGHYLKIEYRILKDELGFQVVQSGTGWVAVAPPSYFVLP